VGDEVENVEPLASWLEELDWIAVRILDLNLSAGRTAFHLIAELHSGLLQRLDRPFDVIHAQNDAIPTARVLATTIGHRPRAGRSGTTEQQLDIIHGECGELRKMLVLQLETEVPNVKIDGASHVLV
jgi:hypothetical protein